MRSIPADAGLPDPPEDAVGLVGVYPRGCGATRAGRRRGHHHQGLSPRMRGYQEPLHRGGGRMRSIPADAGLPLAAAPRDYMGRVYPRGCGATRTLVTQCAFCRGLSPRMRGYLKLRMMLDRLAGSIPADAGLPADGNLPGARVGVYPRGCGATRCTRQNRRWGQGLSPRMRGYLSRLEDLDPAQGSIPADAGLPAASGSASPRSGVYPRGCGATDTIKDLSDDGLGLSPRMRGYPVPTVQHRVVLGSIPADAGLPPLRPRRWGLPQVYPRGCGATFVYRDLPSGPTGLSPRMRGYRGGLRRRAWQSGSIPADAGLPPHS